MSSLVLDQKFMRAAIRYSARHIGLTGLNPCVGCFIVDQKAGQPRIIGRGITGLGGRPHAEAVAIQEGLTFLGCKDFAKKATAYVSLEPCAHYGQTPPCAEALIKAKIGQVVIALKDIDTRVCGRGIDKLRQAGISVVTNIESVYALDVLFPYFVNKCYHRPCVSLKLASSLDHGIGLNGVGSYAITNEVSQKQVHILRTQHDAILVGVSTAQLDNPFLTCRLPNLEKYSPIRIVIDRTFKIDLASHLVKTACQTPVWLVVDEKIKSDKQHLLQEKGVIIVRLPFEQDKLKLDTFLAYLFHKNIMTLLIEGGAKTAETFLIADYIDRFFIFRGQKTIGPHKVTMPCVKKIYTNYQKTDDALYNGDGFQEWRRPLLF